MAQFHQNCGHTAPTRKNQIPRKEKLIQWSAVTVTPSGIGKSVTVTDCHCNSSFPCQCWRVRLERRAFCGAYILPSFSVISLNPLIFDQYELWKQFRSVKSSKKSISGVNFDIWCLRNRKKWGRRCHCNWFFVIVNACLLVLMNRGLQKLSL